MRKTSISEKLFEQAKNCIAGGVNSPVRAFKGVGKDKTPFFTLKANGANLYDADGNEYIDYVGTWGPAIHGHNNKYIKAAIADSLNNGVSFGTNNPLEIQMAQKIKKYFPSIDLVRMTSSGTEATMSAIRLARGYTNKDKIIKFEGCYHGHSDCLLVKAGSGALTNGTPSSSGVPKNLVKDTILLPFNDIESVKQAFDENKGQIACIILEPYMGNIGFVKPKEGYLSSLRQITKQNDALLIFDEVMTGFRVAAGGVQEIENIDPDLTCLGKIIGGGLAVGAFGGKKEIMERLSPLGDIYQAGTLSGNPLAMAAGIASLELLENKKIYEFLKEASLEISSKLEKRAKEKNIALKVPNAAGMLCLYFTDKTVENYQQSIQTDKKMFEKLFWHCLDNGIYLPPSAYESYFLSTAHTPEDIEKTIKVIYDFLK